MGDFITARVCERQRRHRKCARGDSMRVPEGPARHPETLYGLLERLGGPRRRFLSVNEDFLSWHLTVSDRHTKVSSPVTGD